MQKPKPEAFNCNICARVQGTVLLDCYCLFCLDCFQSTDIEKNYAEKAKHYKKGKSAEKCQRCKRNTEYKIYYLDKKSDSDQCRMLFGGLTGGFMSFFRVLEFQTLQRSREIQNLSTTLQGVYQKLGTLLNENSHLSMYFDAKDIKSIQGLNKNFELIETITAQNNAIDDKKNKTEARNPADVVTNTAHAKKTGAYNDDVVPPSAQQAISTEFMKTPHNSRLNKYKEHDRVQNSNISTFQDSSKPRERSAHQQKTDHDHHYGQNRNRYGAQIGMGYEEAVNMSHHRGHVNAGAEKVRRKGMDQKMFEEQPPEQILYKKSLMKNQGNEYETPVGPQLKKAKITVNKNVDANSKEELKKLFGFELKEIKKTSPRPSTDKPDKGNENSKTSQLKLQQSKPYQQVQQQHEKSNYWGRGYHLNYPSYN